MCLSIFLVFNVSCWYDFFLLVFMFIFVLLDLGVVSMVSGNIIWVSSLLHIFFGNICDLCVWSLFNMIIISFSFLFLICFKSRFFLGFWVFVILFLLCFFRVYVDFVRVYLYSRGSIVFFLLVFLSWISFFILDSNSSWFI